MNRRKFFFQLSLLTLSVAGLVFFVNIFPQMKPHTLFFLGSTGFYLVISILIFFVAARAAMSKDKYAFSRVILLCTALKFLLTIVLIVAYDKIAQPGSDFFIIPFFLIYFAYSIFETLFLIKLGKIQVR